MKFALGVLGWSADQFWKSTMVELMAANRGYLKANKPPSKFDDALTRDGFENLKRKLGED